MTPKERAKTYLGRYLKSADYQLTNLIGVAIVQAYDAAANAVHGHSLEAYHTILDLKEKTIEELEEGRIGDLS